MSRRSQATIEEVFDDDTDIPLPARPLPNSGARGALLQAVGDSDTSDSEHSADDDVADAQRSSHVPPGPGPGPASPSQGQHAGQRHATISDLTPYKKWTCIYPIYIDAKREYGVGARRIARPNAVWWPLSKDIADATARLGLGTLHEVQKCHPRDWANPGRVRVQWKKEGRLVNERIRTKKQLLEAIAFYIQTIKPELIPKPPFTTSITSGIDPPTSTSTSPAATAAATTPANTKQQQAAAATKKSKPTPKGKDRVQQHDRDQAAHVARAALPQPPTPLPPLANRVSPYSPALPSGVLVDTIKAGMSAAAAENASLPPGMGGKGKRKVVRVRG